MQILFNSGYITLLVVCSCICPCTGWWH